MRNAMLVNEKIIVISNPSLAKIKTREIKEKKFLRGIKACRRKVPEGCSFKR